MKAPRVDYLSCVIDLVAAPEAPTVARAPAVKTPEGYLVADALLARDGLLKYSDGRTSWLEWRPRAELEQAAASWTNAPVTDDHPPTMVDSSNVAQYMRGVVIDSPSVIDIDGVAYLRARLRIMDAELVHKIEGGQRELSIGFLADVEPERGTYQGQRYDAVQRSLAGNHVASVARGRAGPAVRVLLDGSAIPCYDERAVPPSEISHVSKPKTPSPLDIALRWAARKDEIGAPVTMSKIVLSTGEEVEIPTELAALIEEWKASKKAAAGAAPDAPAAAPSDQPMGEAAAAPAPAPGAEMPPKKPEDEPMKPDAINALVAKAKADAIAETRKRARLERDAEAHAIKCDGLDDTALARAFVSKVMPHAKALADAADGPALDALVEAARLVPEPKNDNPFEVARALDTASPEVERYAAALIANRYV